MTRTIEDRLQRLEDIEDIRKLRNSYSYYSNVDGHPERVRKFTDNFVEDGTLDVGFGLMDGHDNIFAGVSQASTYWDRFAHLTMNGTVEVDGDTGTGQWVGLYPFTVKGDEQLSWGHAYYHDEYVRTAGGWKFKSVNVYAIFFDKKWHEIFPMYEELNPECTAIQT